MINKSIILTKTRPTPLPIVELKSSCSILVDEVISMKETLDGIVSNKPVLRQPPPSHQSHPAMPGQSSQTSRPNYARIASGLAVNNVGDPPLTARSMLKSVHTEITTLFLLAVVVSAASSRVRFSLYSSPSIHLGFPNNYSKLQGI